MRCWCDDCCHNRDFECQLGTNIEITADHECDSFVDYLDTEIYKQVFYRRVERDGVQYKRRCYGKREEQNGIVFYHLAKELGSEVLCTEERTGMLFPHRMILYKEYIEKMKEMIERYTSVDTLPDEPERRIAMDDYVSRGDVLDIVSQYCPDDDGSCSKADADPREMLDEIEALPSADVQPVKHGRWERRMTKIYACSECTNEVTDRQRKNYSFCPYCGTRMDGDSDD